MSAASPGVEKGTVQLHPEYELERSGARVEESKVDLFVNGVCIMQSGLPIPFHRDAVVALMRSAEVTFRLQLNLGEGEATAWGCDLTEEYVIINSAYTT